MLPHSLTNFEIKRFYQNESKFNGASSKSNLPRIKNGAYTINLDERKLTGTHWIALYVDSDTLTYFDSFGVEHIPKKIKKFISIKDIKANTYRIEANASIMYGYFCIGFIYFIVKGKSLFDYNN